MRCVWEKKQEVEISGNTSKKVHRFLYACGAPLKVTQRPFTWWTFQIFCFFLFYRGRGTGGGKGGGVRGWGGSFLFELEGGFQERERERQKETESEREREREKERGKKKREGERERERERERKKKKTKKEREREREREKKKNRERERERHRHIYIYIYIERELRGGGEEMGHKGREGVSGRRGAKAKHSFRGLNFAPSLASLEVKTTVKHKAPRAMVVAKFFCFRTCNFCVIGARCG